VDINLWSAFVLATSVLLVIPGPTVLTVISYSLANGRSAHVPLVAAIALGDCTSLSLSLLGLGPLLSTSAFWFNVVKIMGGLYLLWLGATLFRSGISTIALPSTPAPTTRWRLFFNTYLVTALNPKGIVFFVAFLPQFVNPAIDVTFQLWVLAVTFVLMAMANATVYATFAATARRILSSPRTQRHFKLAGGLLLSAAGVWALLARRAT
jgi:threonine/homoserine/homoserine lactone efflux protein